MTNTESHVQIQRVTYKYRESNTESHVRYDSGKSAKGPPLNAYDLLSVVVRPLFTIIFKLIHLKSLEGILGNTSCVLYLGHNGII